MSASAAAGAYRALLHLYPRRFRAEYGPDMALLLVNQLRDEAGVRVWARTLVDAPSRANWKFLTGGAGVLAAVIVIITVTGEVAASMWWPMMITVLCALMLLTAGLVLGVAHRAQTRLVRNPPN